MLLVLCTLQGSSSLQACTQALALKLGCLHPLTWCLGVKLSGLKLKEGFLLLPCPEDHPEPFHSFTANFGISWHSGLAAGNGGMRNKSYQQLCLGKAAAVLCVTVPETPGTWDGGGIPGAEQQGVL